MSEWRRYEILLPLRFNDGQPVPRNLIIETLLALEQRFGAVSWRTGPSIETSSKPTKSI